MRQPKPSMITTTNSPKKTKVISKTEFENNNLQEQLKLNDMRHKELMKETLLRKKRKQKQLEEEKRQKEIQQRGALQALREERKEQYNKFLKQAVVRNRSCNNSKLQSVASPEPKMTGGYPLAQRYSKPVQINEFRGSNNSFERLERQVKVRMDMNNYEEQENRSHRSGSSVENELDNILERDLRADKLRQEAEKANDKLSPINNHNKFDNQRDTHKPSIENFLDEQPDPNNEYKLYPVKRGKDSTRYTLNSNLEKNDNVTNANFRLRSNLKNMSNQVTKPESDYEVREQRLKNSIKKISAQLPSENRGEHNTQHESDILESINKLNAMLKNKQKSLQEIKKRPKSMLSLQEQSNMSKLSINNNLAKRPNAYYSDFKGPKDILTTFQVSARPPVIFNPYSQMQPHINPMSGYGHYGMAPPPHNMPISVISAPVQNKREEYVDFDAMESENLKHEASQTEKRIIRDLNEIGNIDKENQNKANMKKLRPISLINETNSYSVLTDVMPGRADLPGLYTDKSYFQRRNMQKNYTNKNLNPKNGEGYNDGYESKGDEEGRIQYHPNKLKELFED